MSVALLILVGAVVLAFVWWLMRRLFTGTTRPGPAPPSNTPAPSTATPGDVSGAPPAHRQESQDLIRLRRRLAGMSAAEKEAIDRLQAVYHSQLSPDTFAALCLLTADFVERPLEDLPKLALREEMSSTDIVNYVLMLEDVLAIDISDAQAESILIFGDLVRFVESDSPNIRINGGD